jgi:hypothetical protein
LRAYILPGDKREKKAWLCREEIKSAGHSIEGDVARVLAGKLLELLLTKLVVFGSGTNINIRGLNSISGNTQPLFIVDGVPFASDTNASGNFADGNSDLPFLDLDPNKHC